MVLRRNIKFDLLRLAFASCVLLSHAAEITDGNQSRELLHRIVHQFSLGGVGVDGFFLLSGYLIVQSWERHPRLKRFTEHRMRRILPGYVVACVLSIVVVGLLAPAEPGFFRGLDLRTLGTMALLSSPWTPDAFPGAHIHMVNGAVWTIAFEVRCYLLVALLGLCGILRQRWMWAAVTLGCCAIWLTPLGRRDVQWHSLQLVFGDPPSAFRLTAVFLVGGCFYLFRDLIPYRPALAAAAGVAVLLGSYAMHTEVSLVLFGGYLMFYFARTSPASSRLARLPDISYGMYLYGWPVEALWAWYVPGSPWVLFAGSLVICFGLGCLSWYFVEKPIMARRPAVPLAA